MSRDCPPGVLTWHPRGARTAIPWLVGVSARSQDAIRLESQWGHMFLLVVGAPSSHAFAEHGPRLVHGAPARELPRFRHGLPERALDGVVVGAVGYRAGQRLDHFRTGTGGCAEQLLLVRAFAERGEPGPGTSNCTGVNPAPSTSCRQVPWEWPRRVGIRPGRPAAAGSLPPEAARPGGLVEEAELGVGGDDQPRPAETVSAGPGEQRVCHPGPDPSVRRVGGCVTARNTAPRHSPTCHLPGRAP